MQEEISKHSRKIYKTFKNPTHSISEKLKEITVEVFIIVFAVTLSIWLHSWSEQRHEHAEAKKFLKELKEDLKADVKLLEENKKTADILKNNYDFMILLKEQKESDEIIEMHNGFSLLGTSFNVGRYEGFKSSGKIGTIEDDHLKNKILNYYQQRIPELISSVNFINDAQLKILETERDLGLADFYTSPKMQSKYESIRKYIYALIRSYNEAITRINEIIKEINMLD